MCALTTAGAYILQTPVLQNGSDLGRSWVDLGAILGSNLVYNSTQGRRKKQMRIQDIIYYIL